MSDISAAGWAGLGDTARTSEADTVRPIETAFARCFAGEDGKRALDHLREITLERALGPGASDAALRHLEGQRCLVLHMQSMIDRGRGI